MMKRLWQKITKKDRDSERLIFEMFYQRVYHTAYYIIQDQDLAMDVTQETFIKAFKRIHTVEDGEKLGAWLATIASRTALDYVRKINRWNDVVSEVGYLDEELSKQEIYGSSIESIVEEKVLQDVILQGLDELKPVYRQVLILKYFYDMKYEEIAKSLDIPETTVKARIYRARIKLRTLLEEEPDIKEVFSHVQK